ncbi:unnamed protein product [Rotaria sp. Silwood2]|nr:unnamed protein product [Rotaria sp. Silwood2]CAF3116998.1 unnamed protein product [Rotaria sp. Silwood2]CAF3386181.1 unnamed protein product [Rotaria sp. Silwood2]CAF3448653.1 unnamed protein product [Rotaria sp. Silwood2]CAF4097280.1 unnamed protein product [Rotaria sp. Silwood2]
MLVKHIIAQCTMAHRIDQISITALDAIGWISKAWNTVTSTTISNAFRQAGFSSISSKNHNVSNDIMLIDDNEDQNPIKQLDDRLVHLQIGGNRMSASELVNIDSNIPVFNEWNDNSDLLIEITNHDTAENSEDIEEEEEEESNEMAPQLPEALDILRRLHLFASKEQPELHVLISDLE